MRTTALGDCCRPFRLSQVVKLLGALSELLIVSPQPRGGLISLQQWEDQGRLRYIYIARGEYLEVTE